MKKTASIDFDLDDIDEILGSEGKPSEFKFDLPKTSALNEFGIPSNNIKPENSLKDSNYSFGQSEKTPTAGRRQKDKSSILNSLFDTNLETSPVQQNLSKPDEPIRSGESSLFSEPKMFQDTGEFISNIFDVAKERRRGRRTSNSSIHQDIDQSILGILNKSNEGTKSQESLMSQNPELPSFLQETGSRRPRTKGIESNPPSMQKTIESIPKINPEVVIAEDKKVASSPPKLDMKELPMSPADSSKSPKKPNIETLASILDIIDKSPVKPLVAAPNDQDSSSFSLLSETGSAASVKKTSNREPEEKIHKQNNDPTLSVQVNTKNEEIKQLKDEIEAIKQRTQEEIDKIKSNHVLELQNKEKEFQNLITINSMNAKLDGASQQLEKAQHEFLENLENSYKIREQAIIERESLQSKLQIQLSQSQLEIENDIVGLRRMMEELEKERKEFEIYKSTQTENIFNETKKLNDKKSEFEQYKETEMFVISQKTIEINSRAAEWEQERRAFVTEINKERKEIAIIKADIGNKQRRATILEQELEQKLQNIEDVVKADIDSLSKERHEFAIKEAEFKKLKALFMHDKMKLESLKEELQHSANLIDNERAELQQKINLSSKIRQEAYLRERNVQKTLHENLILKNYLLKVGAPISNEFHQTPTEQCNIHVETPTKMYSHAQKNEMLTPVQNPEPSHSGRLKSLELQLDRILFNSKFVLFFNAATQDN